MIELPNRFAANYFTGYADIGFDKSNYSQFKFGASQIAQQFGRELAYVFFERHSALLLANKVIVFASPYNFVQNAASILTTHFVNKLNELLVNANGTHVETSVIHRKVTYVNDYGFLSKEKRKLLISNDTFYLNKKFIKGKLLLFLDDIRITGTHEEKLLDLLRQERIINPCLFLYYAELIGNSAPADIEAYLNLYAVKTPADLIKLMQHEGYNYNLIVRPIKFLLAQPAKAFDQILRELDTQIIEKLYQCCLGEGYYQVPSYQVNFNKLSALAASYGNHRIDSNTTEYCAS